MMISSRGRYALRVMIDLAEHADEGCLPMKEVAQRQSISLKYLEKIMPLLVAAKLVTGTHGKGGGYRLTRSPRDYPIGEILRLTEGDLAPVACLAGEENRCERCDECPTLDFWTGLYATVNAYIDRYTLADLLEEQKRKQGKI